MEEPVYGIAHLEAAIEELKARVAALESKTEEAQPERVSE